MPQKRRPYTSPKVTDHGTLTQMTAAVGHYGPPDSDLPPAQTMHERSTPQP